MCAFSVAAAGKLVYYIEEQTNQPLCVELQISHSMSYLLFGGYVVRHTGGSWCYCGGERKGTQSANPQQIRLRKICCVQSKWEGFQFFETCNKGSTRRLFFTCLYKVIIKL